MTQERGSTWRDDDLLPILRRTIVVVGVVALAALLIILRDLVLALFAAVLTGVLLSTAANLVQRWLRLGRRTSLALACLVIAALVGACLVFLWPIFQTQIPNLFDRITQALNELEGTLGISLPDSAQEIADSFSGMADQVWGFVMAAVGTLVGAVGGLALVVAAGIFLAAEPRRYVDGAVLLFPKAWHRGLRQRFRKVATGLSNWLRAQLVAMLLVGVLTGFGAWVIGLPAPYALGLFAGLGEFVPIVGPFLALLPALLVAFGEGGNLIWWTIALYIIVQQLEGNVITPLLQERIADVPPVILLFAMVGFGLLFGIVGVILAAPLTVAMHILVREVYVRDVLDEGPLMESAASKPGDT